MSNYDNGLIIAIVDIVVFIIWAHLTIRIVKFLKLKTKYDLFK
jgi:hypothetical protein